MVAAATAVDNGATVIVLEKMAMLGGNTARSEGNMSAMDPEPEKLLPMTRAVRDIIAKYTNPKPSFRRRFSSSSQSGKKYIFDSPELFALQTIVGGNCKNDAKLVLTMTRNATAAMKWLDVQSDMTWFHVPRSWVDVGIGGLYPRGQWPCQADGKTPISTYDAYIRPLAAKVEAAGNPIYKNMNAMANYIADETGKDVAECTFDYLTSDQLAKDFGQATFFTATDGNHGRGVAWAANKLGQKAVVHMPKGSTKPRFDNIAAEGATVTIEEVNYDECVRMAAAEADACERGVIVQDTAWEGYEKIPSWIMEGYGTMASEAAEQLREMAINRPTHVFVQAGVGSLAGAVVGYFTNLYPDNPPTFVVVECAPAACLYKGAAAGDGDPRIVDGDMPSIMAGLCCGEPNILGWDILRNHTTAFVSCPDWVTARGMRTLGAPEKGDPRVISGESGAVTTGLVETLMLDPEYAELKELIGLDKTSSVLCFSTEGDTDPDQYRRIVWEGEYPTC